MKRNFAIAFLAAALSTGCGSTAKKSGTVTLSLDRAATGADVLLTVHVADGAGAPVVGASPALQVDGGVASAVTDAGAGDYTATVTPDALDTEVRITAHARGASVTKTALVFTTLDASLGQPEALDGLVNSAGWEDGANVSPDGQWLIVASYVPLDLLTCSIAGLDPANPACATIVGPYAAPERPGMLGASRISNGTFSNTCPSFGLTTPSTTFTFLPVAAFGFHRQADGSFAEPFVIGFEADGCLGPYGYSFTGPPSGAQAGVVFANHDPLAGGSGSDSDIYYAPITLGQANILGTYSVSGGSVVVSGFTPTLLPPQLPIRQGNPAYAGGRLWWDNEDLAGADRDLYFADVSGTLPTLTAGSALTAGASLAGVDEIQPFLDGNDLYFMSGAKITRATLTSAADPALSGSWTARTAMLGPANQTQPIVATGEPTVARTGGKTELYFVYINKTANGYDANVGRVPFR